MRDFVCLSSFFFLLRCKCIYYAAGRNLFITKVNFFPLSFTIYWKGELLIQLSLWQHQSSSQFWCIHPHRIIWRRDNTYLHFVYGRTWAQKLTHSNSVTCPTVHELLCHNKALNLGHPSLSIWNNQQLKELSFQTNQLLKTHNSLLSWFLGLPNVYSCHMTPWIILRIIWSDILSLLMALRFFSCSAILSLIVSNYSVISKGEWKGWHASARQERAKSPCIQNTNRSNLSSLLKTQGFG